MSIAVRCTICGGTGKVTHTTRKWVEYGTKVNRPSGYQEVPSGTGPCRSCAEKGWTTASSSDYSMSATCLVCGEALFRAPTKWGSEAFRCIKDGKIIPPSDVRTPIFAPQKCKIHDGPVAALHNIKVMRCSRIGTAFICADCAPRTGGCPSHKTGSRCGAPLEPDTGAWFKSK